MRRSPAVAVFLGLMTATVPSASAPRAPACSVDAMVVFDASGSMHITIDGVARIDIARRAVREALPDLTIGRRVGLTTYSGVAGSPAASRCSQIDLRVPLMRDATRPIAEALDRLHPSGLTPLTSAVETAAGVFDKAAPGMIVLVTDGLETCGRSPCAFARQLNAATPQLVVHVIGFALQPSAGTQVACLAEATGGLYVPANTFDELREALRTVARCRELS